MFFVCIFAFLAGVFLRSYFSGWVVFAIGIIVAGIFALVAGRSYFRKSVLLLASFAFASFALGVIRYDISTWHQTDPTLDQLFGKKVELVGVIDDYPEQGISSVEYSLDIQEVTAEGQSVAVHGKATLNARLSQQFSYGDLVKVYGTLVQPQPIGDPANGDVFDYPAYLSLQGIYYQVSFPSLILISHGHGNPIKTQLFAFKSALTRTIETILPEPSAALLEGILLGEKKSLGTALENEFRTAGVIHIVILSGYSINIIASAAGRLFSFLPRSGAFAASSLFIALFAVMSGGTSMVVRASIMAILVLTAQYARRDYDINRGLALTVACMVLYNPKILAFDASFQISLLSVIGLIHVAPIFEEKLAWIPDKLHMRETVVSTVATQVFVLPFILYQMGQFSTVAVPVNLSVLFILPLTIFVGTAATLGSSVASFLPHTFSIALQWLIWPASASEYFLLHYILTTVHFAAHLPFAAIKISHFPAWLMIICYCVYALFLFL